ncbi:hypothetical protein DMI69_20950 [Escherichia coli]|nr:hypothetical protein [Escherichia coli]
MRIPLNERERIQVDEPYILIVPSTAAAVRLARCLTGHSLLNDEHNRALLRGVIASGNRNFGEAYGRAGDVIAGNAACRGCTALNSWYAKRYRKRS